MWRQSQDQTVEGGLLFPLSCCLLNHPRSYLSPAPRDLEKCQNVSLATLHPARHLEVPFGNTQKNLSYLSGFNICNFLCKEFDLQKNIEKIVRVANISVTGTASNFTIWSSSCLTVWFLIATYPDKLFYIFLYRVVAARYSFGRARRILKL